MADIVTIPAARNLVHNPRPANTTYLATDYPGSVTFTFVTDRSYSGTGSIFVTIPAGQHMYWTAAAEGDADFTALTPNGLILRGMIHASGASGSGLVIRPNIKYTDEVWHSPAHADIPIEVGGIDFRRYTWEIDTDDKDIDLVWFYVVNTSGATRTVYLGGFDVRYNQPLDGFVHGAGGDDYSWEGTANNSPSQRAAFDIGPVIGEGGQLTPSLKLYVVNRQNQILRDITENFIDGTVNYDLDAEAWKGTATFTLDTPGLIYPLGDEYLRPVVRIDYPDGTWEEDSRGMFNVDAPTERWSDGHDSWSYEGRDMLSLLANWTLPGVENFDEPGDLQAGFLVQQNTAWTTAINRLLVTEAEFTPVQFSFPGLGGTAASGGLWWEDAVPVLTMLTDILLAAGWQKPWVTPQGVITSAPAGIDPATVTPDRILATGENSPIRWPFEVDPETSRVGNRVRAISSYDLVEYSHTVDPEPYIDHYIEDGLQTDPGTDDVYERQRTGKKKNNGKRRWEQVLVQEGTPPTYEDLPVWVDPAPYPVYVTNTYHADYTETNEDPSHPLSFQRLGRWIDLPLITLPKLENKIVARDHARQALIEASTVPMRVRLTTRVMLVGLNEVYELDMVDAYGNPIASGQGRYWCRGWTMQLGSPWEVVHNLVRVVGFDVAAGIT